MPEMKSLTLNDKTYDSFVDSVARSGNRQNDDLISVERDRIDRLVSDMNDMLFSIDNEKSGTSITITDAAKRGLRGLNIYGRTIQDGVPTPDAPVALESLGDHGTISLRIAGETSGQNMVIATPNGLRGIPVTSGGNYTDGNGQQWVSDYLDFAIGKHVQNVGLLDFSKMTWYWEEDYDLWRSQEFGDGNARTPLLCETIPNILLSIYDGTMFGTLINDPYNIWVRNGSSESPPTGKAYYQMKTPIETPLSEEELAAYAALHTYKNLTEVTTQDNAYIKIEYAMDAKKYLDNLAISGGASTRLSTVTLLASAWTGSEGLYSQMVNIDGITDYSKVDLLPSVEQLAIFHNKDVAFVTENDASEVTVYAIGDKPTRDYTIQVSITEVTV